MNAGAMLVARQILDDIVGGLRFYLCRCGNEQPYMRGRVADDCESCGAAAPKIKRIRAQHHRKSSR